MLNKLLKNVTIIDFTSRLPGPLSTKILKDFGAHIIKIESKKDFGDPFNDPELHKLNPCFKDWYENLNDQKSIHKLDLKEDQKKLEVLCEHADAFVIPDNPRFEEFALKLKPKVIIRLSGGKAEWKSLHDLNALGMSQTFKLHLKDSTHPPYLPFAGIGYGQYLATTLLAALQCFYQTQKTVNEVVYLKDVTENIFNTFDSPSFVKTPRQLHNGAFPAYSLYKTSDDIIICLAAIEVKYWEKLLETFEIELKLEDRFNSSKECFEILEKTFSKYDASAIREKIKNQDLCLTLLE